MDNTQLYFSFLLDSKDAVDNLNWVNNKLYGDKLKRATLPLKIQVHSLGGLLNTKNQVAVVTQSSFSWSISCTHSWFSQIQP